MRQSKLESHLSIMYGLSNASARNVISESRGRLSMRKWQRSNSQLWKVCDLLSQKRGVRGELLSPSEKDNVIVFDGDQEEVVEITIAGSEPSEDDLEKEIQLQIQALELKGEQESSEAQEYDLQAFRPPTPIFEGDENESEKDDSRSGESEDLSLNHFFEMNSKIMTRKREDCGAPRPALSATVKRSKSSFQPPGELTNAVIEKPPRPLEKHLPLREERKMKNIPLSLGAVGSFSAPVTPTYSTPKKRLVRSKVHKIADTPCSIDLTAPMTPTFSSPAYSRNKLCSAVGEDWNPSEISGHMTPGTLSVSAPITPGTPFTDATLMTPRTPSFGPSRKSPRRNLSTSSTVTKKAAKKVPWAVFIEHQNDDDDDLSSIGDASVSLPNISPPVVDDTECDDDDGGQLEFGNIESPTRANKKMNPQQPPPPPLSPQQKKATGTKNQDRRMSWSPPATFTFSPSTKSRQRVRRASIHDCESSGEMSLTQNQCIGNARVAPVKQLSKAPLLEQAPAPSAESPLFKLTKGSPKIARFMPWSPTPCSTKLEGSRRAMSPRTSGKATKKKSSKIFSPWVTKRKSKL